MKLLSWGANTYSQLGHGIKSDQCILPMEIPTKDIPIDPSEITSITGGGGHTLILDKHGQVYSCGWNSKGQLGLPMDSEVLSFMKIKSLEEYKIIKVSCGWDFSMAITQDGTLLAWGSNRYGQLGVSKTKTAFSALPLKITVPKISTMALGLRHAAIVTSHGRVLTCGDGRKGQLGLTMFSLSPLKESDEPTDVHGVMDVQEVACGQYYTVVLTKAGKVYGWGDNKYGQLGVNPLNQPNVAIPCEILTIKSDFLPKSSILCGWTHTLFVTGNGMLMSWGRNTYGQLGCNPYQRPESWKPTKLECVLDLKQVAVGSEHNMVLSGSGQLLCWGWNEHGNCGDGTEVDVHTPTVVAFGSDNHKPVLIGTGAGNCFAVVDN